MIVITHSTGRDRAEAAGAGRRIAAIAAALLAIAAAGCVIQPDEPEAPAAYQPAPEPAPVSAAESDTLVAPIALYPDELVAQLLTAATYPTQIVEANRWMQQHAGLSGDSLARAVDTQAWDPSVKALTQFPPILSMMDQNLAWTSSLGEAYANDPNAIMDAVQRLRQRAQQAGHLQSTPQQTVTTQDQSIVIQPAAPDVVYVPEYDPWWIYGVPIAGYPGWIGYPGLYLSGPGFAFGLGVGIGVFAGFGWGWHHWGADWHGHGIFYNHAPYPTHSPTFPGRRGAAGHPVASGPRPGVFAHPGAPDERTRSGAFSGFTHGGVARGFSARGRASFGGSHGGASHGGGFHGGGHR